MENQNKNSKLNIPMNIRKTLNARFERKELIVEAADKIPELYENADTDELKTRRGKWKVYMESNYISPSIVSSLDDNSCDRFCAVYFRGRRPLTIIYGNTSKRSAIFNHLETVSQKIIEQVPFFSYPKKSLTEENGLSYGIRIGLIISILLGIFVIFDYMLIPNYPEAFLKGANISIGMDNNNFQSLGRTSETHPSFYPIVEKYIAFGWEAVEVDGHDQAAIYHAVMSRSGNRPMMVVCKTTKGKGVSYMENVPIWHYRSPSVEEYEIALSEIKDAST